MVVHVPSQRFKDIAEQENFVLFILSMSNTGMHESKTKTGIIAKRLTNDDRQCAKVFAPKFQVIIGNGGHF